MTLRGWALGIALLMFASMVMTRSSYVVGGADSAGYFNYAQMLVTGRLSIVVEPVVAMKLAPSWVPVFAPGGFRAATSGPRIVPTYPVGLPLHLAAAAQIGWDSAHRVMPIAATACLLLMILIARELRLPEWLGWAAAAVLGAFPTFLLTATQPLSDVVATFWALLAVLLALRSVASSARPDPPAEPAGAPLRHAIVAGVAFAIGVLVRPTNLLMLPAIVIAMRARPRQLALAAAGALPFGIGLLILQSVLYGHPLRTGYGGIGEMLAVEHLRGAVTAHATWLAKLLTPIVFPGGLIVVFAKWIDRWTRALIVAWFAPFFAFYAFYGVYDSWGTTRFLLPAIPALILGALLLIRRAPVVVAAIVIAVMIIVPIKQTRVLHVFEIARHEQIYLDTVTWTERQIPDDAMVLTGLFGGTFLYYENRFTVNWPALESDRFQELRAYVAPRPWYAVLSDVELRPEEFRRRYPGRWVEVSRRRDITLWRLDE